MRAPEAKTCDWCGEQFWTVSTAARFCADRHRHRYSQWKSGRRPLFRPPAMGQEPEATGPQIVDLVGVMPDWSSAACLGVGVDPHPFFPAGPGAHHRPMIAAVKKVCASCPLIEPCAEWAIANDELGVWGGLTESERHDIRRQRRTVAVAS